MTSSLKTGTLLDVYKHLESKQKVQSINKEKLHRQDIETFVACMLAPVFERQARGQGRGETAVTFCSDIGHKSAALHRLGLMIGAAQSYSHRDARLAQLKHSYHLLSKRYHVSSAELQLVDEEIKRGKRAMVEYEHQVREWLAEYASELEPDQVEGWFAYSASDERWARHFINGIIGEVAFWKLLQGEPSVVSAVFTEIGEDVRGADLLVTIKNSSGKHQEVAVDVKTIYREMTREDEFHNTGYFLQMSDGRKIPRVEVGIPRLKVGKGFILHDWDVAHQLDRLEEFAER